MSFENAVNKKLSDAYEKYSDMLFRIALTQTGNREDAMDCVHDVFLKYLSVSADFKDDGHKRAWFIRATVNRCHDLIRYKKIRSHPSLDEISEIVTGPDDTETVSQIHRALASIPEKYRIAVTLHYLEGFSVEETADILKTGVSAVKMRLLRGREMIKKFIETEDK